MKIDQLKENFHSLPKSKVFLGVWIFCALLVFGIQTNVDDNKSFVGIVGSRAVEVTKSYSANVKKVHVIAGQTINKGSLLIELSNPDLELEINRVQAELDLLLEEQTLLKPIVDNKIQPNTQIESLRKLLEIYDKQRKDLFIFAEFDGKVHTLNYKEKENTQPHMPIITLLENNPSTIRGYVHEKILDEVNIGQQLKITSLNGNSGKNTYGKVLSFGSSIVNFPERLLKDPERPMWGREVIIQISKKSSFILGEKVFIKKINSSQVLFKQALASETTDIIKQVSSSIQRNSFLQKTGESKNIGSPTDLLEPSGIIYLEDIKKYLIISDGKNTPDNPQIIILDESGDVVYSTYIQDLGEVDDLESVTMGDDGHLYFVSSLNKSRKGKDRKNIIKVKRNGLNFSKVAEVSLYDLLNTQLRKNKDTEVSKALLNNKNKLDIDVEGAFIKDKNLFLGLRTPVTRDNERAIILKVESIESIFATESNAKVSIEKKFRLRGLTGETLGISDISLCGDLLYMTSAPSKKKGRHGAIFRINISEDESKLTKVHTYKTKKPEGIFCHKDQKTLAVAFDHGEDITQVSFYDIQK